MTTNPQMLDGLWRVHTAVGAPVLHPAVLAELRRRGYVQQSGPVRLTDVGREAVRSLEDAHVNFGAPLPVGADPAPHSVPRRPS